MDAPASNARAAALHNEAARTTEPPLPALMVMPSFVPTTVTKPLTPGGTVTARLLL
jgi:hypothetical protein